MRKTLFSPILAVALMAMLLVMVVQMPQVHAAPTLATSSCTSTYWQYNADTTLNGTSGYQWEFQLYMLRDSYNNVYCGKVYTRVGAIVPPNATYSIKVYNEYYRNGSWIGTTSKYFYNVPECCKSGPYWVNGNAFSAASGAKVTIVGEAQDDTASWVGGIVGTDFWVY